MTRILAIALLLTTLFPWCASGQQAATSTAQSTETPLVTDQEIQLLRQDIQSGRKQVVAINMALTDSEAQKFWPVYDSYAAEASKINDAKVAVIKDYAAHYQNLSDEQAQSMVKKWTDADQELVQLRLKYFSQFQKAVSGVKAARFFQVDRRISLLVDVQLSSSIPLATP